LDGDTGVDGRIRFWVWILLSFFMPIYLYPS
jgi:hypothetical protein